jgi:hypothetical protein
MAGIDRATILTHANAAIVIRFTSDVTLISFRILIFVSLEVIGGNVFASAKIPRGVVATYNTNERRSDAVNDSRPSNDECENGMKAAGSVMKATGSVMKVRI